MHRGYILLWRKVEDSGWIKNHKLRAFWSWCLIKATYKKRKVIVGVQEIELEPGQFIFGRKSASEQTDISERSIRTFIDFLVKSQNMTIKTTNKFSIISIVNWDIYQNIDYQNDQQNDQQLTNNRPTTDHKQYIKPLNQEKNKEYSLEFESFWKAYPNRIGKGAAEKAWKKNGRPSIEIILEAIEQQKTWRLNANGQFRPEWKNPATWINQKCWEDEVNSEQAEDSLSQWVKSRTSQTSSQT
jgi:hypothetical protein